tara:strand:+ start:14380 stop:15681 length:1302 start_codon:yes stop_codon:yes gene_type:complete
MSITQNNNLIFVSIASYRDPELLPTLRDLFIKAKYPDLIRVGLCWQKDESESIEEFIDNENIRIYECDWQKSKGACWARHIIQKFLYEGEEYYFQLDSHHRFKEHWDEYLKNLYDEAPSSKPIIGTYGTTYWPDREDTEPLIEEPYRIVTFDTFTDDGDIVSRPQHIIEHDNHKANNVNLINARLLSGHFIFSSGMFVRECIYDPNLYFRGEEITLSARAYTHGYDMFHPTRSVVWHEYLRQREHKHWGDHTKISDFDTLASTRDKRSKQRQRALFNMDPNNLDFKHYGLGNVRSLHDYELYAGLDFKNRRVHKYAARLNDARDMPEPFIMTEQEWHEGMLNKHTIDITWNYEDVPDDVEFDFWFFGFEDKDDNLLWRKDMHIEKDNTYYNNIFNKKSNTHRSVFSCSGKPDHCVIIPHIKDGDWVEKIIIKV